MQAPTLPYRSIWVLLTSTAMAVVGVAADMPNPYVPSVTPVQGQPPGGVVEGLPISPASTMPGPTLTPGNSIIVPGEPVVAPGQTPPASSGSAVKQAGFNPGTSGVVKPITGGAQQVRVVAVVGAGNFITHQEVLEAANQRMMGKSGLDRKLVYQEAMRSIIDRELVIDEMFSRLKKNKEKNSAAMDDLKEYAAKTADRIMRDQKRALGAKSDEEYRAIMSPAGLTPPIQRRALERSIMAQQYIQSMMKEKGKLAVGLGEVHKYYTEHPDEYRTPDRVRWQDIFIPFTRFRTRREAYDYADAVRQQAAGGADFVALARSLDPGSIGRQNWDGIGTTRGTIQPPDIEPVIWSLRPGEVGYLLETPTGYHVVKVVEREVAGVRPFDHKTQTEIQEKLKEKLIAAESKRMIEDLWRRGTVNILPEVPN